MSNKTIYKRIALVAVTALGAGVLSVAPANAANNTAVGGDNAASATGILNVATAPSITGDAVLSTTVTATNANRSLGLLANSTTLTTSSLTSTATMRADGEIVFYYTGSATAEIATTVVVSGGTISAYNSIDTAASPAAADMNLNAAKTQLVVGQDAEDNLVTVFAVTPNSGATSVSVSVYESAALATTNTAAMTTALANIQSGAVSSGTLKQRYLVTVAATSASGVYNAGESYIAVEAAAADNTTTTTDAANANIIANGSAGYININLNDAYGVALGGKGALIITGTNGALIGYDAGGAATTAASSFNLTQVSSSSSSGAITVARPTAMADKGFSTTVSISWNGVVVGTKSFTFLGEVASLVVTPRRTAQMTASSTTSTDAFRVTYADSAGNSLTGLGTANTTVISSTTTSVVTGAAIGTQGDAVDAAKGSVTCAAATATYFGGGTAKLQLQHLNTGSGTVVKSNVFDMTCQPNAYSYTASFDKTTYTPGSVATLTITFKDRDGDLANGYDTVASSNAITFAGTPSATAVVGSITGTGSTADRPNSGTGLQGIKTFQFVVGSTEGDFQAVVSVPDVNTRNSSQANQTVAYSVKAAVGSVSNADVLKSIVALIASINKQIQALQKLILKR